MKGVTRIILLGIFIILIVGLVAINSRIPVHKNVYQSHIGDGRPSTLFTLLWTHTSPDWISNFLVPETCDAKLHFTTNKALLHKSSFVVFSLTDLELNKYESRSKWLAEKIPLRMRKKFQLWGLFWKNVPSELPLKEYQISWLNNIFNFTISYRKDADVQYTYGIFQPIPYRDRLSIPYATILKWKGFVPYNMSNSKSISDRESFIRNIESLSSTELKVRVNWNNSSDQMGRYSFVLEKEICEDYVGPEYYNSLNKSTIPIVFGGQDLGYDEIGMPGTYIDALDFQSPAKMMNLLKYLQKEDSENIQFYTWQFEFVVLSPNHQWICNFVNFVKDFWLNKFKRKLAIKDFYKYWKNKKCYGSYSSAIKDLA